MDKRALTQKSLNIIITCLFFSNVVQAESSLHECKGNDDTQWVNCQGMYHKDHPKRRSYKVKYTGEFGKAPGMRHSKGTSEVYKKEKLFGTYIGDFKNDKYSGQGIYIWADGKNKYAGEWKNDKTYGQGTWTKLKSN